MGVEFEYQKALWSRLDANKVTIGLQAVYDVAPQVADGGSLAAFPYATIGQIFSVQMDTQTTNGFEMTGRIHTFSRSGSMMECKLIQGQIYGLLHNSVLTVTGHNNFVLMRNDTDCLQDEDGRFHGVCEYRGLVESSA